MGFVLLTVFILQCLWFPPCFCTQNHVDRILPTINSSYSWSKAYAVEERSVAKYYKLRFALYTFYIGFTIAFALFNPFVHFCSVSMRMRWLMLEPRSKQSKAALVLVLVDNVCISKTTSIDILHQDCYALLLPLLKLHVRSVAYLHRLYTPYLCRSNFVAYFFGSISVFTHRLWFTMEQKNQNRPMYAHFVFFACRCCRFIYSCYISSFLRFWPLFCVQFFW